MNIEQRVRDAVDAAWVADRAAELVSVPSVTMNEQEVCGLFEEMMRSLGLDVLVRPITPGRNNLYARIPGSGGDLLCCLMAISIRSRRERVGPCAVKGGGYMVAVLPI